MSLLTYLSACRCRGRLLRRAPFHILRSGGLQAGLFFSLWGAQLACASRAGPILTSSRGNRCSHSRGNDDLEELCVNSDQEQRLLQLSVFGFCLLQDWDVGVGVFPQCKEILIGGAGLGCIALQHIGTGEAKL